MTSENQDGKSRWKISSLMTMVGLAALGFGFLAQTARTVKEQDANQARFTAWIAEVEKANPTLKRVSSSIKTSFNFFESTRNCSYTYQAPSRNLLTIQCRFTSGPFSSVRNVLFESTGRNMTRSFDDLEHQPNLDLKTDFPDVFR